MHFTFQRILFIKVLAAVMTIVCLTLAGVFWVNGSVATRDIIGSVISGVLFSYLLHLWLLPADDESGGN